MRGDHGVGWCALGKGTSLPLPIREGDPYLRLESGRCREDEEAVDRGVRHGVQDRHEQLALGRHLDRQRQREHQLQRSTTARTTAKVRNAVKRGTVNQPRSKSPGFSRAQVQSRAPRVQ